MMSGVVRASQTLALFGLILGCCSQMQAQCTSGSISGGSGFYSFNVTASGDVYFIEPAGGTGTLNLSFVGTGCTWSVSTGTTWLTPSPASGTSSSSSQPVTLTAAPNTGSTVLEAVISVTINGVGAGTAVYAVQNAPGCMISLSSNSAPSTFPASGGSGSFTVNPSITSCWYGGSSYPSWVTPTVSKYSVSYTVAANTGAARNATLSISQPNTVNYTLSQDGPAPSVTSASPPSLPQGTTKTVTFTGTNFFSGDSASVSTTGITMGNLTVISATQASATITVAGSAPTGSFPVQFTSPLGTANTTASVVQVVPALTVTAPTSLANGTVGAAYGAVTFTASGGIGGYTWSGGSGLPSGMSFSSSGVLNGTPTNSGSFNPSFTVTDSQSDTANVTLPLTISPAATTAITIQTSPTGLKFSVDGGAAQTAPQTLNLSTGSHTIAVATPQAGSAGTEYVFASWSDGGAASHSITVGSSAATYTATFTTEYQLTISASPTAGGTVTPASGSYYASGTAVPITAAANSGYTFTGWSGSVGNASDASTSVTMSAPETVTANFASQTGVTIQTSPPGLQFTVDGGTPQIAPQTLNLSAGTHTIAVATPQAGSAGTEYVFASWSDGGAASHIITVGSSPASFTATFTTEYELSTSVLPAGGGTVTANPSSTGGFYDSGTSVQVSATAASGYQFSDWSGDLTGASNPQTLVMSAPHSVTANFTASAPGAPTITAVLNNYSSILPSAPNYGIAPGSLIVIYGSNLATPGSSASPLQDGTTGPLPLTLHGSSVSVTVGSTTVQPAFYYAIPTQLAVVLPSSIPPGTGTITVSYNSQPSQAFPIKVVAHAFGLDFYDGVLAGITDNLQDSPRPGHLITTSWSAQLGETITFWGSGDGADTNNDDVHPPTHFDNLDGITALYIGGVDVTANIGYQGRSAYQGVDQVNVTIPPDAPTGCAVSVVAVTGTGSNALVSNFATMPIAATDGPCTDSLSLVDPATAAALAGKTTVKFGGVSMIQDAVSSGSTTTTADTANAVFESVPGYLLTGYQSYSQPSLGSCLVTQALSETAQKAANPFTLTGIDVGSLSVSGSGGTQPLTEVSTAPGIYSAQLPSGFIPAAGGEFTFAGSGENGIGAISANVDFPSPLVWTNSSAGGTITRAQGVTVTWTGGGSDSYVQITGNSAGAGSYASFVCNAPASPGSFLVPESVMLALPAGTGSLAVSNVALPASFTATGLDFGYALGYSSIMVSSTYQ